MSFLHENDLSAHATKLLYGTFVALLSTSTFVVVSEVLFFTGYCFNTKHSNIQLSTTELTKACFGYTFNWTRKTLR